MKKLRFIKALFAAAALALTIPGCSDLDADNSTNAVQTQGNKIALNISASRGFEARTALPSSDDVDLTKLTYQLTAAKITEETAGTESDVFAAGTTYSALTKANSIYIEEGSYNFTLTASNATEAILACTLSSKAINADSNSLAFTLQPITKNAVGALNIAVEFDPQYGGKTVEAVLWIPENDSYVSGYEKYPLTYDDEENVIEGNGSITSGTAGIPAGQSYVVISLKDADGKEIGSIPQEYVYAVKGITSTSTVEIPVTKYKATVNVLSGGTALSEAKTVTLKMLDPNKTDGSELAVTKTLTQTSSTNEYTGYVSVGSYNVYVDGNKYGVTVSNATAKEVDIAVISSIDFDFTNAKKEYFVGEEFVTTGITATAHYEGGTTGTIAAEDLTYTGFDSTAAATEQTITVTYSGFNGTLTDNTYTINVVEDTISSIAVKTPPTATTFTVGSELDLTGLVITTTYASGKTEEVAYGTDNASQFSVKYYSDEDCGTEVAVADIAAGTVYTKIGYAGKTTDKIAVTAEAGATTVTKKFLAADMASSTSKDAEFFETTYFSLQDTEASVSTKSKSFTVGSETFSTVATGKSLVFKPNVSGTATIYFDVTDSGGTLSKGISINLKVGDSAQSALIVDRTLTAGTTLTAYTFDITAGTTYAFTRSTNSKYISTAALYLTFSDSPPTKKDLVTSNVTAAYTIPSSASGNKGDEATITLSSIAVPTTSVTVSGDTSTTVAGSWTWDDTSVEIAATDWSDGTATVTAKATFTPNDTTAYNALTAQNVTITVTDGRAEASTEVEVTAGKIYYWDLISDVASDSTATATVEDFVNGLKLAVAGGYTVDANYGLQLSANTTFTFPVVSNSRIVAYLTYTGGGAKEIALSVGESALDSVSLNVGDCKAANGPVPVAWAYTGAAGTAVLTVPANVRIAKIVLDTTMIAADSFVGATYTFTSDSNWVAYSGEKKTAKTYYPHLLSGTAGASNIFWYGTNGLAVFNGGADGLKTQPNSENCPVYLTVPVYGACTITVVSSTLDNAPVIYNGGTTVATMTADSQTSTTYSATCKGLTGLNVLSIAIPSANASGTKTQQKIQSISITEASNTTPVTISLTAVGSSDITLAYSNGTLTASAVSGATVAETGYKWYIDNALQSDATSATLNVSALTSGIHSIVVEATDSSTGVTYAAQYVLTVN